jgi:hypothetical protein
LRGPPSVCTFCSSYAMEARGWWTAVATRADADAVEAEDRVHAISSQPGKVGEPAARCLQRGLAFTHLCNMRMRRSLLIRHEQVAVCGVVGWEGVGLLMEPCKLTMQSPRKPTQHVLANLLSANPSAGAILLPTRTQSPVHTWLRCDKQ